MIENKNNTQNMLKLPHDHFFIEVLCYNLAYILLDCLLDKA